MKISAKIVYACRALIELALHWPNQDPLQIQTLARRQEIPMKFLPHILLRLKEVGFVESIRGKSGGYRLAKAPQEILLQDVAGHFGGIKFEFPEEKGAHAGAVLVRVFSRINTGIEQELQGLTFADLSAEAKKEGKNLIFNI